MAVDEVNVILGGSEQSCEEAPAIIFIDEVDSLCSSRSEAKTRRWDELQQRHCSECTGLWFACMDPTKRRRFIAPAA